LTGTEHEKNSRQEILFKLVRADELALAGNSQVDICKALGVSVMTLHRWRKLKLRKDDGHVANDHPTVPALPAGPRTTADVRRVLEELAAENRRLRKIVTDLLLEKMRIEETMAIGSRADDKKTDRAPIEASPLKQG
jgi:putative transposase